MAHRKALEITFVGLTEKNIEQLKKLNTVIFPVRYADKFYNIDALRAEHEDITKLVCHNDVAIGAVCCRIEVDAESSQKKLYIMTLGVLAPYREYGVGSQTLQMVIDAARKRGDVSSLYLHVQTNNEAAQRFYLKHGFEISGTVEHYYHRVEPTSAHILSLRLS